MKSSSLGFIGLGVMGEPMCRNLAVKSGRTVFGFDLDPGPLARLAAHDVRAATRLSDLPRDCGTIFIALPSGKQVEAVCMAPDGLLDTIGEGQVVVDLGTSPVGLTRSLGAAFAERKACFADAPIARTRQAAEDGTLSIMVGAQAGLFDAIRPLLACMATDITHCGGVGTGQVVKILNNMVLIETVVALSEALATAKRTGLDPRVLLETLTKGSADSFALRNHAIKAMLPGVFPERAFSTDYARKDLAYARELAAEAGLKLQGGAELADRLLREAADRGYGDLYWPVVSKVIEDPS